jgi:Glyoxalase superfamily protein/Clp amino terminal domain, pathogenicity island component
MRDFRGAKAMAQTIRAALAANGHKITIAESLELIAKGFGAADWNTLSAAIKSAEREPYERPASPPDNKLAFDRMAMALGWTDWDALTAALRTISPDQPGRRAPSDRGAPLEAAPAMQTGQRFSPGLEASLHCSVALTRERKHGYNTLEHLLLALTEDQDAAAVMMACQVDLDALKATLVAYVDNELKPLADMGNVEDPAPTAGFHRVIQRAVIHVQSAGRYPVTGANVLVAMFSEAESHAFHFLQGQGMTRRDAVNFIAHGIRKGGAAA